MNENNNVVTSQPNVTVGAVPQQPQQQVINQGGGASGTSGVTGAMIVCDKCGTSYSNNQRYCMKCGNLNYSHPSNQSMKQYLNYDVVNQNYINNGNAKLSHTSVDPYAGEKKSCIIFNLILHMILPVVLCILMIMSHSFDILSAGIYFGIFGFIFLMNTGLCLIYVKAKEPWWFNYIPLLNTITLVKIAVGNGLFVLLLLIPGINIIAMFAFYFCLGRRFGRSGILTMLLPIVMIPLIGFSNSEEAVGSLHGAQISLSDDELDSKGRTKTEAEYGKKKGATIFGVLLVVIILGVLLFPYIKEYGGSLLDFLVKKYHEFVELIGEMN